MDTQKQIHQYLEKITRDFQPDVDYRIHHFFRHLGGNILKDLDVYCFRCKSGDLFNKLNAEGVSLSLIHPLPDSDRAVCISLIRTSENGRNIYDISVGTFNLTKTAGNPVDLSAVRMEKVILDAVAGETPEYIKWHGMYRDYRNVFNKTYVEETGDGLWKFFKDIFPKYKKREVSEQIIRDLKNLENEMLWLIANPELNGFRSRQAFNH